MVKGGYKFDGKMTGAVGDPDGDGQDGHLAFLYCLADIHGLVTISIDGNLKKMLTLASKLL